MIGYLSRPVLRFPPAFDISEFCALEGKSGFVKLPVVNFGPQAKSSFLAPTEAIEGSKTSLRISGRVGHFRHALRACCDSSDGLTLNDTPAFQGILPLSNQLL